ncbi:MAG TPA: PocR ligand-binding domain-containing protein [Spirochaetia bacterium]|nr:PocR ligand-binding domain-containing protein [Spirochaetia bacterium]
MKLQDLFTVEEWDRLLGSFKTVIGIAPITLDAAGNAITSPCFTCEACRMIKSTAEGARRCKEGHVRMVAEAKETRKALVKVCHAKFLKITIPIFDGNEFLGVTGGCNVFPENAPADAEFLRGLAQEIGVDGDQLVKEASKARKVSNAIIESQIQTMVSRIRTRMIQIDQTRRRSAAPA